jgi:predicted RNA-binding Zn-ribbon protein involved in translation (DUF1610 family)
MNGLREEDEIILDETSEISDHEWWEFKCPNCGSECIQASLTTWDEVESQYCKKCGKIVATRKLKYKGDLGYLTSYNLLVLTKMRLRMEY